MFHRFPQSKLPCCFLDIQHPFVWYIHREDELPWLQKMTQKWEHYYRKLRLKATGKTEGASKFYYMCFVWQQKQRWACQDGGKHFPKKTVLVLPHSWKSLWNYLRPALPARKSLNTSLNKTREERKDRETTDKHISSYKMVLSQAAPLKAAYLVV